VPIVAFAGIAIPDRILTIPIIGAFAVSLLHFIALYRLRVPIPVAQTIGSAFAAMSLQWTVAKAIGDGLIKDHLPFARTAKGGVARITSFQAFWEAVFGGLLIAGAIVLVATNQNQIREINIFAAVLVIQSLPFLAAVAMATLEGSRLNEFAYWANVRLRLGDQFPRLLLRRNTVTQAGIVADNKREPLA
jgi:glycerol uptake facilitator-like aquaporin